jgi:hypothetical protein
LVEKLCAQAITSTISTATTSSCFSKLFNNIHNDTLPTDDQARPYDTSGRSIKQ